jgi:hypothetical protein
VIIAAISLLLAKTIRFKYANLYSIHLTIRNEESKQTIYYKIIAKLPLNSDIFDAARFSATVETISNKLAKKVPWNYRVDIEVSKIEKVGVYSIPRPVYIIDLSRVKNPEDYLVKRLWLQFHKPSNYIIMIIKKPLCQFQDHISLDYTDPNYLYLTFEDVYRNYINEIKNKLPENSQVLVYDLEKKQYQCFGIRIPDVKAKMIFLREVQERLS